MSINWVMLQEQGGFVHLPNEKLIYTSPPRTSFALQPLGSYTGPEKLSVQSSAGCVYLTNQRVVYLPASKTNDFQSFAAPLLNIYDSHVTAPFFGPNVWISVVQPVAGGGIPPSLPAVQLKVTFKDGGAYDFHTNFERIKERLQQVVEVTRETGGGGSGSGRGGNRRDLDLSAVHLEDLPAYDGPGLPPGGAATATTTTTILSEVGPRDTLQSNPQHQPSLGPNPGPEPSEPPPGYEEVQQQSVADVLEESLRRAA